MSIACAQTMRKFVVRERVTVVPLLPRPSTGPSLTATGDAAHEAFPKTVKVGGRSPPPMWEMEHRAGGGRGNSITSHISLKRGSLCCTWQDVVGSTLRFTV